MIHSVRRGQGAPLLLLHGLGGNWRSWSPVLTPLARHREAIAIDLPGHGKSPARENSGSFAGLVDSVEAFIADNRLGHAGLVGSSMGARMVLELARRGHAGNAVALNPGGFWRGWERDFFRAAIGASVRLLRAVKPALPALSRNPVSRSALLAQLSARPWALDAGIVAAELSSYVATPTFDALVHDLATGPAQSGPAARAAGRIVIGWGRQDRLCLPRQAARAQVAFPNAELHWFDRCGHFPVWDVPGEAIALILGATSR